MNMKVKTLAMTILSLLIISQSSFASVANYNQKFNFNSDKQIKGKILSEFLAQADAEGDPTLYEPDAYRIPFDVPPPPSMNTGLVADPIQIPGIELDPISAPPPPGEDESPASTNPYPTIPGY